MKGFNRDDKASIAHALMHLETNKIAVAYVGENGILPNRKYTLNDSHEFVEVK